MNAQPKVLVISGRLTFAIVLMLSGVLIGLSAFSRELPASVEIAQLATALSFILIGLFIAVTEPASSGPEDQAQCVGRSSVIHRSTDDLCEALRDKQASSEDINNVLAELQYRGIRPPAIRQLEDA